MFNRIKLFQATFFFCNYSQLLQTPLLPPLLRTARQTISKKSLHHLLQGRIIFITFLTFPQMFILLQRYILYILLPYYINLTFTIAHLLSHFYGFKNQTKQNTTTITREVLLWHILFFAFLCLSWTVLPLVRSLFWPLFSHLSQLSNLINMSLSLFLSEEKTCIFYISL